MASDICRVICCSCTRVGWFGGGGSFGGPGRGRVGAPGGGGPCGGGPLLAVVPFDDSESAAIAAKTFSLILYKKSDSQTVTLNLTVHV